ncbi:hypothetical protein CEXT_124251 [Caerostris extrusa]|uniref:Homing endonuclease LAGLIDADG domain-containing protein n=1 Tax=Caerostris extrusa TaxID=172846 RepID=A0AAV4U649_CAEEX|nr:hypothetical protein CEXT_124251 [Caerostris extrusa]
MLYPGKNIESNDVVRLIMNMAQGEMFKKKCGSNHIYINGISRVNTYDFELTTLLTSLCIYDFVEDFLVHLGYPIKSRNIVYAYFSKEF